MTPAGHEDRQPTCKVRGLLTRRAAEVAEHLRRGAPSIWVMNEDAALNRLQLELVPLQTRELQVIVERLRVIVGRVGDGC